MSMELHVLSDRPLTSISEWQHAIEMENLPLRLDSEVDLATVSGFVPAQLDGKQAGFECFHDEAAATMKFLGEDHFDRPWRFALGVRWLGSRLEESQAAWMAAIGYSRATGGIIFDHEEGRAFTAEQAHDVLRSLMIDAATMAEILEKVKAKFSPQ